ncbi:MAG: Na+/H+ antiporter NhaC family protein [Candidatus Babeliales bacterium]
MENNFLVLLPPLITLSLAFITRKVKFSLLSGILIAAFIATDFSIKKILFKTFITFWQTINLSNLTSLKNFLSSNNSNMLIILFLFMLGIIITLINHTGASCAYGRFISKKLKTSKEAEVSCLALSSTLFVDDYFSSLTVGSVMYPVTDNFKIPRVKLAFLVNAMASSLCALSPVSSWMAAIVAPLTNAGISDQMGTNMLIASDTFWVYLHILPFIFYSIILILGIWFIVLRKISFGSIKKYEKIAQETGNLFGGKTATKIKIKAVSEKNLAKNSLLDFIFPIILLSSSLIFNLLYSGGCYLFGGTNSIIKAFQAAEISYSLFISGFFTLTTSLFYYYSRRKIFFKEIGSIFFEGINLMLPAILVLILAWTFGSLIRNDLHTGQYLASKLVGNINLKFLPIIFFIISMITSVCIGSAWGTIAIMVPITIPMLLSISGLTPPIIAENLSIMFPVVGAIISGAIIADHISPLSDTMVMASASTGANLMDLSKIQLLYTIPIIVSTAIAFLLSGFLIQYGLLIASILPLLTGSFLNFAFLQFLNQLNKKNIQVNSRINTY